MVLNKNLNIFHRFFLNNYEYGFKYFHNVYLHNVESKTGLNDVLSFNT